MIKKSFFTTLFLALCFVASAQNNTRISDNNNIGWYAYVGTFQIDRKFGIHTEYQFRRDNFINDKQQGLMRIGINYQVNPKIQLRAGYANIETYPYGDININSFGKHFTEHRSWEMATIADKINIAELSHRFLLEQRWIGRYNDANSTTESEFLFMNRIRYMFRIQLPLQGKTIATKTIYIAAYNEILLGFGTSVNENIFDQNRLGVLLGYKFNNNIKIESGYLNQIVQLGREIGGRNVFQYNNGFILSTILNFELSKNK